jgi:hypothetical protein
MRLNGGKKKGYKILRTHKLEKLAGGFAKQNQQLDPTTLKLAIDGHEVDLQRTPGELRLQDDTVIDVSVSGPIKSLVLFICSLQYCSILF